VWGADEENLASLRLARRLGFTAVDELWVAPPTPPAPPPDGPTDGPADGPG
jgi:hypothetical protein